MERDEETARAGHAPGAAVERHDLPLIRSRVQSGEHEHRVAAQEEHLLYADALAEQQPVTQLRPHGGFRGAGGGGRGGLEVLASQVEVIVGALQQRAAVGAASGHAEGARRRS